MRNQVRTTLALFHPTFIRRQVTSARKQSTVLVLCVALSMVTLVALRGFGDSVNRALLRDAQALQAADITVDSNFPLSEPLEAELTVIADEGAADVARTYEFVSVVRVATGEATLLSNLKIVEPGYPFYGEVTLASGRPFHEVLQRGTVVVAQELLDSLALQVGDQLQIGQALLTIGDVVTFEPDRPVNFFTLGPRIFIADADREALDLIKPGSRVDREVLLRVSDEGNLDPLADRIANVLEPQEDVETYRSARSGVQRFFENLLLFLGLVAIFTLLLSGIGIQSALTALLRERDNTIAVMKTLGATGRFVTTNFLAVIAILGLIGTALGIAAGLILERLFPLLLGDFLPPNVVLSISPRTLLEGIALGAVVVTCFTLLPVFQLDDLKPNFIFRKEAGGWQWRWSYVAVIAVLATFFVGMVLWQLQRVALSLYFIGSIVGLLMLTALLTWFLLWLIRRLPLHAMVVRQALRGLFRPRNATHTIVVTLSAALAVIFCVYLLERNLNAAFVEAYPEDAPNAIIIDVQPEQREGVAALIAARNPAQPAEFVPTIRASIIAINGEPIDTEAEERRRGDNLARPYTLTYRDTLAADERLMAGEQLFPTDGTVTTPVSILDTLLPLREFQLGDRITFRIQGVPLEATVTSIRALTSEEGFAPFFTFIFPAAVLGSAPQSIFAALRMDPAAIGPLRNEIVAAYPNITVIDITETVDNAAAVAQRLARVIRFFSLFSVLAGVLIVVSSVYATRQARVQEAVYYKVLGADRRFVRNVFVTENLLLGGIAALLALLMAQVGSWALCRFVFEIAYQPTLGASVGLVVVTMALVTGVGMAASQSILASKPILILRELTSTE
jgi:putative ABC transport system permease protein